MFAWQGKILTVNLTEGKFATKPLGKKMAFNFLGGRGFNIKTLFDAVGPGTDPLSPENILCFAPGTLTGTTLALAGRLHVSTLSPYSGILGDGNAGGKFAHAMKQAGLDQIVITGKAPHPAYLFIEDAHVEILDAADLWGTTTWETTDRLKKRHGKDISVASIGQAGENLVRCASTMVDKYASAARGSGAVWGSKQLKAIVVKGTGRVTLADKKGFLALSKADKTYLREDRVQREVASVYGSQYGMTHWFPGSRYFEKELTSKEVPRALRPEAWKQFEVARAGCQGCHVKCKSVYEIPHGNRKGEKGEGLEYECIYCLGTNCGIDDPVAIMEMENLCDQYGMDVVALGNTVAFAKALFNKGIITTKETHGLNLNWDACDDQIELIHQTALRRGFGNTIAEGMYTMAKIIGNSAMDNCHHVKGLSRGVYPPGIFSLAHAVSTRGADHLRGRSWAVGDNSTEDVLEKLVKKGIISDDPVASLSIAEKVTTMADTIGRCKGAVNTWTCALPLVWQEDLWEGLAGLLTTATGLAHSTRTIEACAERIHAVERAFNIRQGISIRNDGIPQKPEHKDTPQGKMERQQHFDMVRAYYRHNGYDPETGFPAPETLTSLDLGYIREIFEKEASYPPWDGPSTLPLARYPQGGERA